MQNCPVKVKYTYNTTNMRSHQNCHPSDLIVEEAAKASVLNQPAAINATFEATLLLPFLRAANIIHCFVYL